MQLGAVIKCLAAYQKKMYEARFDDKSPRSTVVITPIGVASCRHTGRRDELLRRHILDEIHETGPINTNHTFLGFKTFQNHEIPLVTDTSRDESLIIASVVQCCNGGRD